MSDNLSRRDVLTLSGLTVGLGMALAGCGTGSDTATTSSATPGTPVPGDRAPITEIAPRDPFYPGEPLAADEMRISILGSSPIPRIIQEANSVFVELGNGDSFVFDCGSGVTAKYIAMGVPYSRMDKIFLTHLHADHTSDLVFIFGFGPSTDRKYPLSVWGPTGDTPQDGTQAFCDNLKAMMKWHIDSFSFLNTGLVGLGDGFDINVTELPYMDVGGVAYEQNGVKITHFPAVHDRDGAISYKLEWNGLSMVFSGDSRPTYTMLEQARGVDVLIHEMVVPPETWATGNSGLQAGDSGYDQAVSSATTIQNVSHTPQKALGYILSQTGPRLGVATHFQVNDNTVGPALRDVRTWWQGPFTIATDLLVINVSRSLIRQRTAVISDTAWYANTKVYSPSQLLPPKFSPPTVELNQTLLDSVIPESVYAPPA